MRILSLIDRREVSNTYGCADRNFWNYKISDFPNSRLQEVAYTLALYYKKKGNESLKSLCKAVVDFWCEIQNKDGSFNEAFPREHSHAATAFSGFAIAKACMEIGYINDRVLDSLEKAGKWLLKNSDIEVVNHEAGALAFLTELYKITNNDIFLRGARKKLKLMMKNYSKEGWFIEYGGFDYGYSTVTIYYLAHAVEILKEIKDVLKECINFLKYFSFPDGSVFPYGSRNTYFFVPDGLVIFENSVSKNILSNYVKGIENRKVLTPKSFDDRYLLEYLYTFYHFSNRFDTYRKTNIDLPYKYKFRKFFRDSKIFIFSDKKNYLIVNILRGSLKLYSKKSVYANEGYFLNGHCSSLLDKNTEFEITENRIVIKKKFLRINSETINTKKYILIRIMFLFPFKNFLKKKLRERLILSRKESDAYLIREIILGNDIKVNDKVPDGAVECERITGFYLASEGLAVV